MARISYVEAEAKCIGYGGHLASIHSESQNQAIWDLITDHSDLCVFIGLNDIEEEGAYSWLMASL